MRILNIPKTHFCTAFTVTVFQKIVFIGVPQNGGQFLTFNINFIGPRADAISVAPCIWTVLFNHTNTNVEAQAHNICIQASQRVQSNVFCFLENLQWVKNANLLLYNLFRHISP